MYTVTLTRLIEKMNLGNYTPEFDTDKIELTQSDVNRPALQLAGFFDHFDSERLQLIGNVEFAYMQSLPDDLKAERIYNRLFSSGIPCLVFCRGLEPSERFLKLAKKYEVPILSTARRTSEFASEVIRWLNVELAPRISIHGVLVDVYGEGVLIMGESGIGKSEAALELIRRGHRLVSDDVVEIKRVSDETLVGSSPEMTRHLIELRGIGIIDVKTLFGVENVKMTQSIDLVIQLEEWNKNADFDRMGLEERYIEFLGNKVVCHAIPIRPGRNLAVILESAAINFRAKKMGYNAAQALYERVTSNIGKTEEK